MITVQRKVLVIAIIPAGAEVVLALEVFAVVLVGVMIEVVVVVLAVT